MTYEWEFWSLTDYEWEFDTSGRPPTPLGRACFRGPMIAVEQRMALPFTVTKASIDTELLRNRLLDHIVDTTLIAVRTRETVLRSLSSPVGPLFVKLTPLRSELQVLICEKRNSIDIDNDLLYLDPMFEKAALSFENYGIQRPSITMLVDALRSNSPVLRVAARCGVILTAAFIELG